MQTIIERVLEEEEKARRQVEDAKKKASQVKAAADEKAEARVSQSRAQALDLVRSLVDTARRETQESLARTVAAEEEKSSRLYESARSGIAGLSEEIAAAILKTDIRKD